MHPSVDGFSRPPARRPRARRTWPAAALLVVLALGASWWVTNGAPGLPSQVVAAFDMLPGVDPVDGPRDVPPPSDEVVALADAAHLSAEGREIFYGTQPEILGAQAFAGRCTDGHAAPASVRSEVVGCYNGGTDTIVLYAPADPRLYGFVVETAAHEGLHAAWERLTAAERSALELLLEAEVAATPADDPIHAQITGSVGENAENRPTELFAYVGTQLWREGGLAPELEVAFSRFVADRAALVAVHTGWRGMLDGMGAEITAAWASLGTQESGNAQSRAQLDADRASVAFYDESYREKAAEVDAMSADEKQRLRLSWVWWDGTDLPMAPAVETLAAAAGLLARDDVDLAARESALVAAEAVAAAERTRIDGLVSDLEALQAQLSPVPAAG
ncbi:hypothetical protein [Sanguibacter sp. 25GB23B1]|uniref:hypothetical protein n=1 Tax=unclassified Sanguibacter TaxID=2645534 RepID=UPI0032AEBAF7